ncbi:MAG TPA: peroxidase family protein, partial [Prosthecobacter sp.]|nr:peroxidase family protein [Prosthecobacter sp.]
MNRFLRPTAAAALAGVAAAAIAQPPPPNGAAPIPRMQPPPQGQPGTGQKPPPPNNQQPPPPPANGGKPTPPSLPKSFVMPAEFRSTDGSGNNVANPVWGTPNQPFLRLAPNAYSDSTGEPAGANRPSARAISNAVAAQPADARPNRKGASDMLWQWGQFLDHDLTETPTAAPAEAFPISVPTGDPQFDPTSTGTVTMGLNRSAYDTVLGVREQKSTLTAYIDASQVYGSDEARALALRALDGTGRLKVTASAHGDLLPMNVDGVANIPPGPTFFLAGDVRVNEQAGLIAIHTLFMREHNFWADLYRAANPDAEDEEIYQFARLIVGAEMQAITYREFLPVLLGGGAIPPYRGYKAGVDPTISNEFATAAYRFGHSMLSSKLLRLDAEGKEISAGHLTLAGSFFQPQEVTTEGIDVLLRGLVLQRAQELDEWLVDDVRNFLFGPPGAGGLDLASLNLQRGRDHGLRSFADMRTALKLRPVKSFQDVNRNRVVVQELSSVYDSPADIDLWIGGLSEVDKAGSMVGEVFHRILVNQFVRLRDGDRFWYQLYLPPDLVRMVEKQTLSTIIRRNTKIGREIPDRAFLAPPPPKTAPVTTGKPPPPLPGQKPG